MILQGSVSNGEVWQFGKLQARQLVRDSRPFTISALSDLFSALHDVFERAKQQALTAVTKRDYCSRNSLAMLSWFK